MVYIIAEAGVNHDGRLEDALKLIDVAAASGADCVKFQMFSASKIATNSAPAADYQVNNVGRKQSQVELLSNLELPQDAFFELVGRANQANIEFLSTPFDAGALDFLANKLRLPRIKIGSGDLTNAPLLYEAGRSGCSVILSTGMAILGEIEEALGVLALSRSAPDVMPTRATILAAWNDPAARATLRDKVSLLHCTTEYPCPPGDVNLRAMDNIKAAFGLPVGYSDHTLGAEVSIAAVARGASIIEKHITLSRDRVGPDHAASLEPREFAEMVKSIRNVEAALGDGLKTLNPVERKNVNVARKSVVAARRIACGEVFTADCLDIKRPGTGLSPIWYWDLIGRHATQAYNQDDEIVY